jgi:hypothetical protein
MPGQKRCTRAALRPNFVTVAFKRTLRFKPSGACSRWRPSTLVRVAPGSALARWSHSRQDVKSVRHPVCEARKPASRLRDDGLALRVGHAERWLVVGASCRGLRRIIHCELRLQAEWPVPRAVRSPNRMAAAKPVAAPTQRAGRTTAPPALQQHSTPGSCCCSSQELQVRPL